MRSFSAPNCGLPPVRVRRTGSPPAAATRDTPGVFAQLHDVMLPRAARCRARVTEPTVILRPFIPRKAAARALFEHDRLAVGREARAGIMAGLAGDGAKGAGIGTDRASVGQPPRGPR